jgi:hypothetical protein
MNFHAGNSAIAMKYGNKGGYRTRNQAVIPLYEIADDKAMI